MVGGLMVLGPGAGNELFAWAGEPKPPADWKEFVLPEPRKFESPGDGADMPPNGLRQAGQPPEFRLSIRQLMTAIICNIMNMKG